MKKLLALSLVLGMALTVLGCANNAQAPKTPAKDAAAKDAPAATDAKK